VLYGGLNMLSQIPILSLLICVPIIGGFLALMTGDDKRANVARWIAVVTALISMALCVPLWINFDTTTYAMQFAEQYEWIPKYGIFYSVGVDGISMPLAVLSTFTTLVVILASWKPIKYRVAQYMAAFLIMQGMMVGAFCALDTVLFYIFWEGMLIPMYLCIGMWGMANRNYASIKFFLFTFLG
jgi:NADH-quinone oxidoreductase subunit M